ncbi:MAG: hypothetical protein CMM74_14585, partial [Rhodospirillaceae bacterium]|jgi:GT2 family glycosyltransferase|nr:hypothetical protein [Rhodospirillaceae bacterium]
MDYPLITILAVNYNHSDFIALMLYGLQKLTHNPYKVIICDNGSVNKHVLDLVKTARKYDNVELVFRQQGENEWGSISHGIALDILIGLSNSEYTVVMDGDCTVLAKDWDQKISVTLRESIPQSCHNPVLASTDNSGLMARSLNY